MKPAILLLTISLLSFLKTEAQTSDSLRSKDFLNEKVNIAGVAGGEISKEVLLNSQGLSLDKEASSVYHIISFRLTLVFRGVSAPLEFANVTSGELTSEMREAIGKARAGNKLFFEHIYCADKNNVIYSLPATEFVLK